jgi:large conductance mechanosensitive channel
MWKDFKKFIMRGNIIEIAIAFILGSAFGQIVSSLVRDIIMPPIGLLLGRVSFSNLFINLTDEKFNTLAEAQAAGAPTINYGVFINTVVSFLIIAFVIFIIVRQMTKLLEKPKEEQPKAPSTKTCPYCFTSIPIQATRCPNCTSELEGKA